MEETVIVPSPNWFQASVLAVTSDGWLIYGGPAKNLVLLEPLSPDSKGAIDSKHRYKAHVLYKGHKEKIVSVDISPEWSEKRHFITGSIDGVVKEWSLTQVNDKWTVKNIHSHDAHAHDKEDVVTVGYSMGTHAVSVGNFSVFVVWDLNSNVTKKYESFLRNFKATCMSCSPHSHLVVAVGTRQGVVFVVDLNGKGKLLYKVRGQDEEVSQVSWCPQYEVILKRDLHEVVKKSTATLRMEAIRNQRDPEDLDESGAKKDLPDDSFDEPIVVEDNTFDIYKDHEVEEFGHKKYQPENILVKVKEDPKKDDFLAECEKLKAQILKNKQAEEESIGSLVEAMDKTHVDGDDAAISKEEKSEVIGRAITGDALTSSGEPVDVSAHIHKHLLASVGKMGNVRIWSKSGKIVATGFIQTKIKCNVTGKNVAKGPNHSSICWYKPDVLLIADGRTMVFECNPLKIDSRTKLHYSPLNFQHRRGLYCIATNAPRVQTEEMLSDPNCDANWIVFTTAQDRMLTKYSVHSRKVLHKMESCGGFLYCISPCQYDAGKLAVGVGDGAVRVWENQPSEEDDSKLVPGECSSYWQNVQGKILQCVWHPTKENLLAFSTAESRVGIIDTSGKNEKAAKVMPLALSKGVYSLRWGDNMTLFAVGNVDLVMYQANKPDEAPVPIRFEIEGQRWEPSVVNYSQRGLMVGSNTGGVAIFSGPGGHALAAKFVFPKLIHAVEWHPQQTSGSDDESQYKNLLAVCSIDKSYSIVILQYEDKEGGGKQLSDYKTLSGHTSVVYQVYWSPHRDGQLLSTSQDGTARVWDCIQGVCTSIFGHANVVLSAAWCPRPQMADVVLSGGGDYCLRLWNINDHPAEGFTETKLPKKRSKRPKYNKEKIEEPVVLEGKGKSEAEEESADLSSEDDNVAEAVRIHHVCRRFLLPVTTKQLSRISLDVPRLILQKYIEKNQDTMNSVEWKMDGTGNKYDTDSIKLFGNINEVNELLDLECEHHLSQRAYDAYILLMIFRGHIDSVIQFANDHDILDSFLLSIAPCVSFKYWKDVTQMYIAQLDRLAAKRVVTNDSTYGGIHYRKAAALLSVHDVRAAVDVLLSAKLYKEAYVLCRCRHMDSIASEVLNTWAYQISFTGNLMLGAIAYIANGRIMSAAQLLRRSTKESLLNLGAEIAKAAGLNTFADFIENKAKAAEKVAVKEIDETERLLEELPTRIDLLMKENKYYGEAKDNGLNGEANTENGLNGEAKPEMEMNGEAKSENGMNGDADENGESTDFVKNASAAKTVLQSN